MSQHAQRWDRLAATLANGGHSVTVEEHPYSEVIYGRVRRGVARAASMRLDDGCVVEIGDEWWRKNSDVWVGWRVTLADVDGITLRSFPLTKKRGAVAVAVADALVDHLHCHHETSPVAAAGHGGDVEGSW